MPATLIGFATQERDTYTLAQTNAQAALSVAQSTLAAARKALDADLATLQSLDQQIAAKRAQLATSNVPSDVAALNTAITALVIQHREQQFLVLDDQSAVASAQAALDHAQARLEKATARLAQAEDALAVALQEEKQRQSWKLAMAQPPLSTLTTDAGAALTGALYTRAKARFADIPARLWEIAAQRHELWTKRLGLARSAVDYAGDQLAGTIDAVGGWQAKALRTGMDFRRAERKLADLVLHGKERYDRAIALLQRIAAADDVVLTPAEKNDVNDAALKTTREVAQANEKAVNTAQVSVDDARAKLEDAILVARAKDPNKLDVSTDPGVTAAQGTLTTARGTLTTAQGSFTTANKGDLSRWAAVLPDPVWRQIVDFLDATALLNELKNTSNPLTGLDALEKNYADALQLSADNARSVSFLEDALAARQKLLAAAEADQSTRLLSATRGDAN